MHPFKFNMFLFQCDFEWFTLKIPEIASVKLDVYDSNKNSLISIANARNAPQVTLIPNSTAYDELSIVSESFNSPSPN